MIGARPERGCVTPAWFLVNRCFFLFCFCLSSQLLKDYCCTSGGVQREGLDHFLGRSLNEENAIMMCKILELSEPVRTQLVPLLQPEWFGESTNLTFEMSSPGWKVVWTWTYILPNLVIRKVKSRSNEKERLEMPPFWVHICKSTR